MHGSPWGGEIDEISWINLGDSRGKGMVDENMRVQDGLVGGKGQSGKGMKEIC